VTPGGRSGKEVEWRRERGVRGRRREIKMEIEKRRAERQGES
jgi:hypothetical protein